MSSLIFDCRFNYPGGFLLAAKFAATGKVTALFGPSGAGKSTILSLIAGLLRPLEGRIELAGQVFVDTAAGRFLPPEERQIGVVFQDRRLFPHLSVRKNLVFGAPRRTGRPASGPDFERVVQLLDIGELLHRLPSTLSGGQQQRVAIGRALLRQPRLLLMDEPVAGLEEGLKDRILGYVERVVDEWRVPTLFVSHDQSDVRRLADQVIVVDGGTIVDAGPTATTLAHATLRQLRQPASPINWLRLERVEHANQQWQANIGRHTLVLPASAEKFAGRAAYVQFLPSDVTLAEHAVPGLSARNQLPGRVSEVIVLEDRALVAIDVGQLIWAELTPGAIRELAIEPQKEIVCVIKASAMSLAG